MEATMTYVQPFFDWLLQTTLSGSVIIGLILVAQKVLGGKLGPRWSHALWLVLLIRLVLPGTFTSQINLLNLVPSFDRQIEQQQLSDTVKEQEASQTSQISDNSLAIPDQRQESDVGRQEQTTPKPGLLSNLQNKAKLWLVSFRRVLPFIWVAGAMVIGVYLLMSNFFLWRIVKRERPLLDQKTLELFEECKERMGVQTIVGLIPSAQIKSPALFGFIRPRLLLPMEMLEEASQEEMRYIFLHELAHLKRRDIYLGWLTSFLQILHWFNPLVWVAFYRMRADRELSCDAFVLSRTGKEKSKEYGQAIVGLLSRFSHSRPLPAMAGILENKTQLKRRITMIAQFKKNSYQWSPLAVFLILAVSFVSLSFAVGGKEQNTFLPKSEPKISLRRVETGPMSDFSGPPSLDGRYICDFQPTSDVLIAEIVIRNLATGEVRPLTKVSRAGMWHPVISPDSTHIAYMNQFYPSPETELQLINMDGTGHRALHRFKGDERLRKLSWTLDGKHILGAFKKAEEDLQLVKFSIEDGSMQVIHTFETNKPSWNSRLVISPDGRYIAYERAQEKDSEDRDIFILDSENNQTKPLIQHIANDRLLGWTPDNSYIFFASDRKQGFPGGFSISDTWDAYLLPVAEGMPQGASELVKRDIPAKIRPKGFTRDGAFYYAVEFSTMEAVVAEVDMQAGKLLTKPQTVGQTGTDVTPAWSYDGRYLAYGIQKPDKSQTIRIRNMETGQERELDPDLPHFFSLRWSPDGKFFLASNFKQNLPQAIYRINASTGERVVLVQSESALLGVAQLSREGRTLFYVLHHPDSQKASLMTRDMESSLEKKLFSMENASNPYALNFAFSPDGQQLALTTWEVKFSPMTLIRRILTMPAKGGEPKELFKNEGLKQYPLIAWTPDGQFLLFNNSDPLGVPVGYSAVWLIPAGGGQARELCRPQTMMFGVLYSVLDVHPDGRRIAFDCFEYRHEVWAMENFLPATAASKRE
jgi:beta-lactamase regulating signal transducer with metallopeptidase domain/Tol biopolymer transport system component